MLRNVNSVNISKQVRNMPLIYARLKLTRARVVEDGFAAVVGRFSVLVCAIASIAGNWATLIYESPGAIRSTVASKACSRQSEHCENAV